MEATVRMHESTSITEARMHMRGDREKARAAVVAELGLIDVKSTDLDIVASRAARIMDTSIGAVTVLLHDKQYLIARAGIDVPVTDRTTSFCTHVTAQGRSLTVRDATRSPFFTGSPAVGFTAGSIRAYCGIPITLPDDTVIAVLCVVDARARTFTPAQVAALEQLADTAYAILLPTREAPPVRAHPPKQDPIGDLPSWCRQDDLYAWIESVVPDEAALVAETHRRAHHHWWTKRLRHA